MNPPSEKKADVEAGAATPEAPAALSDDWLKRVLIGKNPRWTLARVGVLVATVFILFKFIFIPIEVVGISMEPNYVEGQIRLVNKLAYRKAGPQRGDVVAVRVKAERVVLLKRVIALPGERFQFIERKIRINGKILEEPYLSRPVHPSWSRRDFVLVVPQDQYVVIGDNRSMPLKDHTWYLAERDEILGKVLY